MLSKFIKFTIVDTDDTKQLGYKEEEIFINIDHLISIKPINIIIESEVVRGLWLRTTNGKKYKAISAPQFVYDFLSKSQTQVETQSQTHHTQDDQSATFQ